MIGKSKRRWTRRIGVSTFALALAATGMTIAAPSAYAATTWHVATPASGGNDANPCTAALPCASLARAANVSASGDTVNIGPGAFATNVSLASSLTIVGAGANATFLDGGGASTVLGAPGPSTTFNISDLTIRNGNGGNGSLTPAGVSIGSAAVTLTRVAVTSNIGTGVFDLAGNLHITDSSFTNNTIGLAGFDAGFVVSNSTFSQNGLGIHDASCCSHLTDLTVAENSGDGIVVSDTARPQIVATTIAGNGGFGIHQGFFMQPATNLGAVVSGTIISGNAAGNCSLHDDPNVGFTDSGYNLESDAGASCSFSTANHDLVGVDPALGSLTSNGGPTDTMKPGVFGGAIDAIPNPTSGLCPGTDQRGIARPVGAGCDIGAVEAAANAYVATGGADTNPCSQAQPCATLGTALVNVASGGTVHVGPGTFSTTTETGCVPNGSQSPCSSKPVIAQALTVVGTGVGATDLEGGITISGFTRESVTISDLTLQHGSIYVGYNVGLTLTRTTVANQSGIFVDGELQISDSTVNNYGTLCSCGPVAFTGISGSVVENGGGIIANADQCGCVGITDSTVRNNSFGISASGGGVAITRTNIIENSGTGFEGGGLEDFASNIVDSTISGNGSGVEMNHGAIHISGTTIADNAGAGVTSTGTLTINQSTISHNGGNGVSAVQTPGCHCGPDLSLSNTTVAANTGDGVIVGGSLNEASIAQSTIAGNHGVGVNTHTLSAEDSWSAPSLNASVVANNAGGNCLAGPTTVEGSYNLENDAARTCGFTSANHDLVGINPQLGPLQDNGGTTQTMLPAATSPLVNAIPSSTVGACFAIDQRGISRPQGPACDIGAVERIVATPVVTANPSDHAGAIGDTVSFLATATSTTVPSVRWQVSTNGGTSFTNIAGATNVTYALTATPADNGHLFRAVFANEGGSTTTTAAYLLVAAPTAPTAPAGSPNNAGATVHWTAPSGAGGVGVTGYVITPYLAGVAQAPRTFDSTVTSETVTGLTNTASYTFTVAAKNAIGTGPQSVVTAPILVGLPNAATAIGAVGGSGKATVHWIAPSSNGGSAITGYIVTPYVGTTAKPEHVFASTATSEVITGLTNGTKYTFKVAATNARGTGLQSLPDTAITLGNPATPSAPTSPSAGPGSGQVTLTWTAPTSNGSANVTGYIVTPYIGAVAQPVHVFNAGTTQVVTSLTNAKTYTFKIAAGNAAGTGPQSSVTAAVTVGAPTAPSAVTATSGVGRAAVSWTAPLSNNGAAITGYIVTPYLGSVAQPARTFASTATSEAVTGLTATKSYTFRVTAKNSRGAGRQSTPSNAVTPT